MVCVCVRVRVRVRVRVFTSIHHKGFISLDQLGVKDVSFPCQNPSSLL